MLLPGLSASFPLSSYAVVAMHEDVEAHLQMKYLNCTL